MVLACLYRSFGMMGTSSRWVLGSKPNVKKPTPISAAIVFTCTSSQHKLGGAFCLYRFKVCRQGTCYGQMVHYLV